MNGLTIRSKKNQKIPWDKWKWKHNNPKPMEHSESSSKREIHNISGHLKKQETFHLKEQSNFTAKGNEKNNNKQSPK